MDSDRVLLLDPHPSADMLATAEGEPVWPARTGDERRALAGLAALFGSRVQEVPGHPGPSACGAEEVVALGGGVEQAARLYAHLTRRRLRFAGDIAGLATTDLLAVVVTTPARLDEKLLDFLYARSARLAPGIICADAPEALRRQVLVRAAASVLCGPLDKPRIDFFPTEQITRHAEPGRDVWGGLASAQDVREAVAEGAGVLHVFTHSDGVDAHFGPDLILCPFEGFSKVTQGQDRSPRCQLTRVCHRWKTPVEEALASGRLLSLDAPRARILVWNSCKGLIHPEANVSPEWGLILGMLDNPALGAVITTSQEVFTAASAAESLCRALVRGERAGKALAAFNRSKEARRLGLRMCLLGDPRIRLPAPGRRPSRPKQRSSAVSPARMKPAGGGVCEAPFLQGYLMELLPHLNDRESTLAITALNTVLAYEQAAWRGAPLEGHAQAQGPFMRNAILQFLLSRSYGDAGGWLPLAHALRTQADSRPCHVCGRGATTAIARLRMKGVAARRIVSCPRCGIVEDAPVHAGFRYALAGSRIQRAGPFPEQPWQAGVLLEAKLFSETRGWEWITRPDGTPETGFEIPRPWPCGPLQIWIYTLWQGNFALHAIPTRGDHDQAVRDVNGD